MWLAAPVFKKIYLSYLPANEIIIDYLDLLLNFDFCVRQYNNLVSYRLKINFHILVVFKMISISLVLCAASKHLLLQFPRAITLEVYNLKEVQDGSTEVFKFKSLFEKTLRILNSKSLLKRLYEYKKDFNFQKPFEKTLWLIIVVLKCLCIKHMLENVVSKMIMHRKGHLSKWLCKINDCHQNDYAWERICGKMIVHSKGFSPK